MSHELTQRANGFTEMAYVGQKPWHELGQEVTKGASIDVWRKQAGLDWQANTAVAQYHNRDGLLLPFDGKVVLYRSDTSKPVGLVSDQYKVVQPEQILETFRDMIEGAGWYIHTAGTLRGGSKIWAMATHDGILGNVAGKGGDSVKLNLLACTSLDGSMKTKAKLVSEVVVCANTLRVALAEGGEEVSVSHRSEFDPEDMKDSLKIGADSFAEFVIAANNLADRAIGTKDATDVLRKLFGAPTEKPLKPTAPDFAFQKLMAQFKGNELVTVREQRSVSACIDLFAGSGIGANLAGREGTRWGLLQAVTQHIDHDLGRTDDTRMDSAWFGRGEAIKGYAFELLNA